MHILSLGGASAPIALEAMCDAGFSRGLLLVATAGNIPTSVAVPARFKSVIAVSSIDSSNVIAPFS